jgi:5'-hydroxyaverantin dehydrogenase
MSRVDAIPLSAKLSPEECAAPVTGSSLKDKSVLITGGASGLGAAIALAYAEKGYARSFHSSRGRFTAVLKILMLILSQYSAYVTLADINEKLGNEYTTKLQAKGLQYVEFAYILFPSVRFV